MKRTQRKWKRFRIDDPADMDDYEALINDPLVNVTQREMLDEKDITSDSEGNTTTTIRPVYLVHWEEELL